MALIRKRLSLKDKEFCRLIAEAGLGPIEAARKAYGWRCESPGDYDYEAALNLAKSNAMQKEIAKIRAKAVKLEEAKNIAITGSIDAVKLRDFAISRLIEIRDDVNTKSSIRFQAIKALEKLHDPSSDINLIWRWIDIAWRGLKGHCPRCHHSFPLSVIKNKKLDEFRRLSGVGSQYKIPETDLERRLEILKLADKRNYPHPGQIKALEAPERNIIGTAAARSGKSVLLAMFSLLGLLVPGAEIWIIARIYEDARSEVEYLKKFISSLFYPYQNYLVKEIEDKKSGELIISTKWGSELRVRSAKSKGSITGRELDLAIVAEPGWVDESIYEEIRARMSSRLGRIIALGTPKGVAGFIGRMVNATGRDPKTGKIIRLTPEQRLIKNGCPWNISTLVYQLNPQDNPAYVKSELDAARMELTDAEYDSEFRGLMVAEQGAKFPHIKQEHLKHIDSGFFSNCIFGLGIDQGPVNFGAVLVAWNGKTMVPCYEYFDSSDWTMRRNLSFLRREVPNWIRKLGGNHINWIVTACDRDPPIWQILEEMKDDGIIWPHDLILRHQNNRRINENWRRTNQEMINNLSRTDNLLFHLSSEYSSEPRVSPGASLLHTQMIDALDDPEDRERESRAGIKKGWIVNDPWRQDHVLDAFFYVSWAILSGAVQIPKTLLESSNIHFDPWAEAKAAFQYKIIQSEREDLSRFIGPRSPEYKSENQIFEETFKRRRSIPSMIAGNGPLTYKDES